MMTGTRLRMPRRAAAMLIATFGLAACATQQQLVSSKEDALAAAGFIVRPANTPERQNMLNRLPPHHFVQRVRGDDVVYVYADPLVCDCLYVGSQQAFGRYKRQMQEQRLADEQEMTAEDYSDPAWSWGAWGGGWGPGFGPGFGMGYGW